YHCGFEMTNVILMRIAHITPVYPPYKGGMGNVARDYVMRLREAGHDAQVFTMQGKTATKDDPPYVHRIRPLIRIGNAGVMPSIRKAVLGFDVVHLHYPFFGAEEWLIGSKVPLVITYHMDATAHGLKGAIFQTYRKFVMPMVLRSAKTIFVSSREYASASQLKNVRCNEKIIELPFAVDTKRFYPGHDSVLRSKLGIQEDSFVFIFVGGMDAAHAFKGIDVLLKSASRIMDIDFHVLLVGDGELRAKYEKFAQELGIEKRAHFLGSVSDDELPPCYRASDAHILSAINSAEAFGLVTLEAAASGIPSIVTDLPGVRTLVVNETTGYIVPVMDSLALAEKMRELATKKDNSAIMGSKARIRAMEKYSWESVMKILVKAYEEAI
ncbi:MAG: glycosyl transferase group 1, partial [uncultured bacterium]